MVDNNDQEKIENDSDHQLHVRKKIGKTLVLKPNVEQGKVRQNFSHGRTKTVVVEKRKKRTIVNPNLTPSATKPTIATTNSDIQGHTEAKPADDINLTDQEREARLKALSGAKIKAEIEQKQQKELEKAQEEEATKRKLEEEKANKDSQEKKAAETKEADSAVATDDKNKDLVQKDENKLDKSAENQVAKATDTKTDDKSTAKKVASDSDERKEGLRKAKLRKAKISQAEKKTSHRPRDTERRRTKLTITNLYADQQRERSLASLKRKRERQRLKMEGKDIVRDKISRNVIIPESITIQELANRMSERSVDVVKILMKQGQMLKPTDIIDPDSAQLIAEEMGHNVVRVAESDVEDILILEDKDESLLHSRPPIVAVMGHVDHGKTSLLDAIRNAGVAEGEAGGITQHIGAYQITTDELNHKITFLDTPGHESFSAIRARGAKVTDIVVLVVAADDGIMPQTIEAINHAKASEVPIIVAINKIDLPSANPDKIRSELLQHEVLLESMGGDVLEVEVSAKKGTNLDKLIEAIMLQGELLELKANPNRQAEGTVIESKLDKGRGAIATVIVQKGTLTVGDIVVAGTSWGKVRALIDEHNNKHDEALPSKPVEILGLNNVCAAGDYFAIAPTEQQAREIVEYRDRKEKLSKQVATTVTLDQMFTNLSETADKKEMPVIIKGDVHGSVEAIIGSIEKINTDEVSTKIVHSAAGGVTDSDVTLAMATGSVILAFNVRANPQTKQMAEREGIEVRYYSVIYNLIDDIKAAMSGMLSPTLKEHFLGNAEVLEVFNISKIGKIAGCRVTEGKLLRSEKFRLIRDNVVIYEGDLSALKRFKDDASEVNSGQECGMSFENFQDLKEGDVVECYEIEEIQRTIS